MIPDGCKRKAQAFLMAALALTVVRISAAEPVVLDDGQVHPTRLLARLKPGRVAPSVPNSQLRSRPGGGLNGRLLMFDDPARATIKPGPEAVARLRARMAALRQSGDFDYVEPDYLQETTTVPNDEAFSSGQLWGLRNPVTAGMDVNAAAAWDLITGSTNVIVAVIDTGIRYTHQDLRSQMWQNPGEIPGNGLDDDHNGYVDDQFGIDAIHGTGNPFDTHGHGTHVGGTIGAAANDGHPHVGVAWNVRLLACRFIGPVGGYTSDGIESIEYAVRHGATIINASWGSRRFTQALYDAIATARDAGVLFVAAAGNSSSDFARLPHYPSGFDLDNVVSVAAIDRTGALAQFSNYGSQGVHLGAPGVEIFSCFSGWDSQYRYLNGTSMAAPHVAGVAALVSAQFPNLSMGEVRRRLFAGAAATASLVGKTSTGGRVDAYGALTAAQDGRLEITMSLLGEARLQAGSTRTFVVRVSDLRSVTNASVTADVVNHGTVTFLNDGVAPDIFASDEVYTATLVVPGNHAELTFNLSVAAPGFGVTNRAFSFPVLIRPPNDDFTTRTLLIGNSNLLTGNNLLATREAGEPLHVGLPGQHSMWWSWVAPSNGFGRITYISSRQLQILLGVYTGTALETLTPIAVGDSSTAPFPVRTGEAYHIAVDGYRDSAGEFSFSFTYSNGVPPGPANDFFAFRQPLFGLNPSVTGSNVSATLEQLEPRHNAVGKRSIWWTWTPEVDVRATVDAAGIEFGILAGVYLGNMIHELSPLAQAQSSVSNGIPRLTFNAAAGRSYQILVDSQTNRTGPVSLSINSTPQARPSNDDFAQATPIPTLPAETTGALAGATWEPGEPGILAGQGSVWFQWTAPSNMDVIASLEEAVGGALYVYSGDAAGSLVQVGDPFADRRVAWHAMAGMNYRLRVNSLGGAEPSFVLMLTEALAPVVLVPPNHQTLASRTLRLDAEVFGAQPLLHQWHRNGVALEGQTNGTLVISQASENSSGDYTLTVSNPNGIKTSTPISVQVIPFVPTVGVFADPRFFRVTADPFNYEEPVYLHAAIERIGYPARYVTNLEHCALSALVVPNQRWAAVARGLEVETRELIKRFVRDGGLLLVAGSFNQRDVELMDALFGFDLQGIQSTGDSQVYFRSLEAEGTPFAKVPDTIESAAHSTIGVSSLPPNSASMFQRDDRTLAAVMPYGDGNIVYLGPLFLGLRPLGSLDGGLLALLEAGLRVGAPPLDRAPVIEVSPQSRFAPVATSATLSVSAYGSEPLAYQWYRGEDRLPLGTNATITLNIAGPSDNGFYYAIISNAMGVATSDVARVVVASQAQHVPVFHHPDFVRTGPSATNEAEAVQGTIRYFGYSVDPITNFAGLSNHPVIVVPSLENGDLGAALNDAQASTLSNYVAEGGALIVFGDTFGHAGSLLHRVFGWHLEVIRAEAGVYCYREELSRGNHLFYCPRIVVSLSGSYSIEPGTLPSSSTITYLDTDSRAIVAQVSLGRGRVFFVGWNWSNAVPLGSRDSGWLTVLSAVLAEAWAPIPRPELFALPVDLSNFRLTVRGTPYAAFELQSSSDLKSWSSVRTNLIPASGLVHDQFFLSRPRAFYRVVGQ